MSKFAKHIPHGLRGPGIPSNASGNGHPDLHRSQITSSPAAARSAQTGTIVANRIRTGNWNTRSPTQ
eukprot:16439448-Heterocapsa_arctica.AAC.1